MILYPALELKNGVVIRLRRDAEDNVIAESCDPLAEAKALAEAGCRWLHLDDPERRQGAGQNHRAILADIQRRSGLRLQLAGVSADHATIEQWLDFGVDRVVIDAASLRPPTLKMLCAAHPGRIAVALTAIAGRVPIEGWSNRAQPRPLDIALRIEDAGAAAILFATAGADGALSEMDIDSTADLAFSLHLPVISAGPVTSLADIESLKAEEHAGIEGVVISRALYDGRLDLNQALAMLETHPHDGGQDEL